MMDGDRCAALCFALPCLADFGRPALLPPRSVSGPSCFLLRFAGWWEGFLPGRRRIFLSSFFTI